MSKTLCIKNKIFSFKGKMFITDEHENMIYEANGEFAFVTPTWRITHNQNEVASLKRKVFSWTPTWSVSSFFGDFFIKRKLWSWSRCYTMIGGPFDGAVTKGTIWDLKFKIENHGEQIAKARGKIFSIRDMYVIEVLGDDEREELLTVITMVALLLDRKSESSGSSSSSDSD